MGGIFPQSRKDRYRMCSQPSTLAHTELEVWIAVGSRLHMVNGKYQVTAWNQFYPVFITLIKNMKGGKTFQPILA